MKFKDAVRFFEEKGVTANCHVCNGKSWEIHLSDQHDDRVSGIPTVRLTNANSQFDDLYTFGVPVLLVECSNCGSIRTFNVTKIMNWAKVNPEKKEASDPDSSTDNASQEGVE